MKFFAKLLPYVLVSLTVVGLWWLLTRAGNYAWFPKGKELLMLDLSLTIIFFYKTAFWLLLGNLTVYIVKSFIGKGYKSATAATIAGIGFYFAVGQFVDVHCAPAYYRIFVNQSVSEEHLKEPIKQAGYEIGSLLTSEIKREDMKLRRYAVSGLADIHYYPATETLRQLLFDKNEPEYIRADAYVTLTKFDTAAAKKAVADFESSATDSGDKKVVGLGNSFLHAES